MAKKKGAKSAGLKFYHEIQTGPIVSSFFRAKNYIFLNGFVLAFKEIFNIQGNFGSWKCITVRN